MRLRIERLEPILLAGAAGDGAGAPFEGARPEGARNLPPPPWRISDDTRLTFATCRAIAAAGRIDPEAIAGAFVEEYRAGLPGVGSSTLKALRDLDAGQHWALSGARGEFAAGNGAAMRAAPLAFFGDAADPTFARTLRDVAGITHRNDEAIASATAMVIALQLLAAGQPRGRAELLRSVLERLPDTAVSDTLAILADLPADARARDAAERSGTSGRAASSVPLALFIAVTETTMEAAIVAALRCGGDVDTIAAMAAQLRAAAGDDVPSAWHAHLPVEEARRLTSALASLPRSVAEAKKQRRWWFF
jgi:ADP-ribosyl-[dinitrogen reductase] hydrolase